jgi:hypothetical protein
VAAPLGGKVESPGGQRRRCPAAAGWWWVGAVGCVEETLTFPMIPCRNNELDDILIIEKGLQYIDSTLTLMGQQSNNGVGPHTHSHTQSNNYINILVNYW